MGHEKEEEEILEIFDVFTTRKTLSFQKRECFH